MAIFVLFVLSGLGIAAILFAKRHELRNKRSTFLLVAISKGDEHMRELSHRALHIYSTGKHRAHFFFTKVLPLKAKGYFNKTVVYVQGEWKARFGNIRGEREIAKPESISEFFKIIKEVEKGMGEIQEEVFQVEETVVEAAPEPELPPLAHRIQRSEPVQPAAPAPAAEKTPKKRAPRKKKIPVTEVL